MFYVIFRFYLLFQGTGRLREGYNEENGPKRRVRRRLGHRLVFIFFSRVFFITNECFSFLFPSFWTTTISLPPPSLERRDGGGLLPFLLPPHPCTPLPLPRSKRETEGLFQRQLLAATMKRAQTTAKPSFGP
jgi:hypothetical protein